MSEIVTNESLRKKVDFFVQPWAIMADLAEAVDDLICSFDYLDTAMDNLALNIFIWTLVVLTFMAIIKYLHKKYRKQNINNNSDVKNQEKVIEKVAEKIVKSSDSVLATSAGIKSANVKPKVTASPMARRKLTRMSPGPELTHKRSSIVVPSCTGADQVAVTWVNELFRWLYNDLVIVNELIMIWISSLNEHCKNSVIEQGVGVELVRALDSQPPSITNVFCECDTKDDVTITCDCDATPAFQLKAYRQKGEKVEVTHYRVNVNRFRARLNIVCITDRLIGELKCDGWPEVKIALAPVGPIKANLDESTLQNVISDLVVSSLRNTHIEFNLSQYGTCPRFKRHLETPSRFLPLHYDSMLSSTPNSSSLSHYVQLQHEKRLLVKVVAAKDLGGTDGCKAPFCIVEMDEPPQKNQTAVKKDTSSPNWDEHFLFDLAPQTSELLFEVYDRVGGPTEHKHKFLGWGLVGIDELLVSPSQRQVITLQGRPMEETVTGQLTVEFMFIEGADLPEMARPFKIKESLTTVTPTGQTYSTIKTTFQNPNDNTNLSESALRDLQLSPNTTNANKSTLIIHSVQRNPKKSIKVTKDACGNFIEVESVANEKQANATTPANGNGTTKNGVANVTQNGVVDVTQNGGADVTQNGVDRKQNGGFNDTANNKSGSIHQNGSTPSEGLPAVTPRKKRRDFFGTIKRRLGRSRTRGSSMDKPDYDDDNRIRSISADRNAKDGVLSLSNRNVYSAGTSPAQSGDESRTSRSSASARTFIHEASTLVLETLEAGIRKHYLVPLAIAQKSRWRRKGVKLHIYNDHTFIAKHLSGGTVCRACNNSIARRLGKQGYECRDCGLQTHKHCHVKTSTPCPKSTVSNMELTMLPILTE